MTRLSLLSGGEKALGAISFLFALFLARPCPFYLLDEVEAALDDTNIGRFVELLRRYSDRAQFIVVTHQKRTMEAADVLYGVTMGADGVSQIVSRRRLRDDEQRSRVAVRAIGTSAAVPTLAFGAVARSWAELLGEGGADAGEPASGGGALLPPARLALEEPPRAHGGARLGRLRPRRRRAPGSGSRRR